MQEMSVQEARSSTSLLELQTMCTQDGSSLPLAGDVRRIEELQGVYTISRVHDVVLLALPWDFRIVCLGRDRE